MDEIISKTCCFFGNREINETEELKKRLTEAVEWLITEKNVDTFLFGSKSRFDTLCLELVTKIKQKHPYIKRVYVRAEYENIGEQYNDYLHELYEDSYYPEKVHPGKAAYVQRNRVMIDKSTYCVVYSNKDYVPKGRKSGTKIALAYAIKKKKEIILFPTHQ